MRSQVARRAFVCNPYYQRCLIEAHARMRKLAKERLFNLDLNQSYSDEGWDETTLAQLQDVLPRFVLAMQTTTKDVLSCWRAMDERRRQIEEETVQAKKTTAISQQTQHLHALQQEQQRLSDYVAHLPNFEALLMRMYQQQLISLFCSSMVFEIGKALGLLAKHRSMQHISGSFDGSTAADGDAAGSGAEDPHTTGEAKQQTAATAGTATAGSSASGSTRSGDATSPQHGRAGAGVATSAGSAGARTNGGKAAGRRRGVRFAQGSARADSNKANTDGSADASDFIGCSPHELVIESDFLDDTAESESDDSGSDGGHSTGSGSSSEPSSAQQRRAERRVERQRRRQRLLNPLAAGIHESIPEQLVYMTLRLGSFALTL